jgi:uncharacterized protein (TIGR03663 family)
MKSRDRNKGRPRARTASEAGTISAAGDPPPTPESTGDPVGRWFVPLAVGILVVAAALRLPELAINPFHHDEGVNGFFMTNLVRDGTYVYDPANYHGPSLYYFALASEILFGLTTEAMRLVPVLFGLALVALTLTLRRYLGSVAVLVAGALLAVSPGAVYFSRYFIHETLVVALSMALIVATTFYLDRREARFLVAAAATAALLFATKETGIITVVVLLIATAIGHAYTPWRRPPAADRRAGRGRPAARAGPVWIDGVEYRPAREGRGAASSQDALLPTWIPGRHLAGAALVFLVLYVLLYSSFFTNFPKGLIDSLATFTIWTQTGEATQVQPIYRYLQWLVPIGEPTLIPVDVPILLLGVVGGLVAAIRAPSRFWVVIGLWAAGITAAYSIIQYKTPWIILNMLLPLALLAGLAVSELWRSRRLRLAAPVVLGAAVLLNGYQAIDLNFNRYDDPAYAYVYVHSTRSMLELVDEIETTADRAGTGHETGIVFVTPDYWPLPWYFRDYPRAGFFGEIVDTGEAMIVANVNQEAELAPSIAGRYDRVGTYTLRPGVDLVLYVRTDIPKE